MTAIPNFGVGYQMIDTTMLEAALQALSTAIATAVTGPTGPTGASGAAGAAGTPAANVVIQNQSTGVLTLGAALPTTDPGVANSLWNDLGIIRVSAGA